MDATVIPDAAHYLLADNPEAVADLIEQHAGSGTLSGGASRAN